MVRTIGVVLAGGRSSRMGTDKAAVVVGDRPMAEHVVRAVRQVADSVAVAGSEDAVAGAMPLPDSGKPHRGPLAGIAAAAAAHPDATLVVVAVDQPWVRPDTLRELVRLADDLAVVPVDDGVRQTTCAVYPPSSLAGIDEELEGGGSIQSLLDRTSFRPVVAREWQTWGEDGRSWFSADAPTDVERGLERFGAP